MKEALTNDVAAGLVKSSGGPLSVESAAPDGLRVLQTEFDHRTLLVRQRGNGFSKLIAAQSPLLVVDERFQGAGLATIRCILQQPRRTTA